MTALDDIEKLLATHKGRPPIEKWHPALSGDIDIQILADGRWIHEGGEIRRHELVKLFASILRREEDGEYYLLTPVEKWRIRVDDLPLLITDYIRSEEANNRLLVKTNVDTWYELNSTHQLLVETDESGQPQPSVVLEHGLAARVNRACFYRLVEEAVEHNGQCVLQTSGGDFVLGDL
ncbi:DUF1285 domain-containing protein [Spongiibacter sp. KMU-158]|uniref:DUF1285 domain-containing protein n=1 Tax=Spongiibacter pelagi TaxID=2760804 RepID=A0A927C3W0_9GAMM|nr:DUF1285 domain-containing protein [Spongiibacter pelagi]MBD2859688.1 DUF1285 domain-containing protein [Spongiibacter pelagi]